MKKLILISFCILILTGCATAHKLTRINLGMSKEDVIKKIGRPVSVSVQGKTEYLNYRFFETGEDAFCGITDPYYVRIIDGKVESYGKLGDFDSTKVPETKTTIDLNLENN